MTEGTEGKASSGAKFRPPPATIWNNMVDAGRAWANGRLDQPGQERIRPRETDLIKIRNDSGTARRRGEILRIKDTDRPLTDLVDEHIWLKGLEPTADGYFGILKDPAAIDGIEQLQVSGVCIALVDVTDETHTHAAAVATEYVLGSASSGPVEILYAPDGTGEKECVVRFGGGSVINTAYATITASDEDDQFQVVSLYRKAIPATFTTTSCGSTDFDDMEFTLSELIETGVTVLVPAGYKGGEALLVKWNVGTTEHLWTGWAVVVGPTWRCATRIPTDIACCPTTQVLKFTEYQNFWFFGQLTGTTADPCP